MRAFWPSIAAGLCLAFGSTSTSAEVVPGDLMVAARALGFLEHPPTGEVTVGIVYEPSNARSNQEAEALQKMFGSGLKSGDLTLKPVLVKLDDVGRADVGVVFLTEGVGAAAMKVAEATRTKHILCITTDTAQVQSGACVMSVHSEPKTAIQVNRAAAAASGAVFTSVFRMMITEF